ncbi:hypothetical protein WN944_001321 [Citrus x changshan-huyou]|uniref:Vacuolar protein sorting-associated protein 26C n=1 Tax=Citrus x changshan-huyou TaxID=2935761 RepID=A0AAP0QR97_9ROSI
MDSRITYRNIYSQLISGVRSNSVSSEVMAPKQPNTGLFVGLNKGHIVTKKELPPRPADRKGKTSKRVHFVRTMIREVAGFAPYEKMITELLKVGKDKRALKLKLQIDMSTVEIKLSRSNRIYRPSEPLQGKIVIKSSSSIFHYGIHLTVNGSANLQVRGGSAGVVESLYGVIKPIKILKKSQEIRTSGRIGSGTTEIPFSMNLKQHGEENLERFYETFHGADINIQYLVTVDIMRGYLHKSLSATVEFIVETDKADLLERPVSPEMVVFYITQDTQRHPLLPELKSGLLVFSSLAVTLIGGFKVTGKISTQCSLSDPITGELTVEASSVPIHSIDIHLLRMESILLGEKIISETSLIQTTQVADGDVCRNMTLPIYVILPRLLTCPTVLAGPFSVEFKVSVVISFQSELSKLHKKSDPTTPRLWLAMETLPLELVRTN